MGLFQGNQKPLQPGEMQPFYKEFPSQMADTYGDYARRLGEALLGHGTTQDATAQTQEAYRQYMMQTQGTGEQPLPFEQWVMQQRQMR